ncbi:MAG: hypothetical protein QOK05_2194 [Chloroflexota bacterium]|jgi:hypothetical protein|nr:hypothetical protein [Chloroflexota bacterium]
MAMANEGRLGLQGLITCLGEQQMLRGTGVLSVGDRDLLYVVFGHPLHAVSGERTGIDAVDAVAGHALAHPDSPVAWTAGVTAGRAHSLSPADGVADRLRRRLASDSPPDLDSGPSVDRLEDLGLRRRIAASPPPAAPVVPAAASVGRAGGEGVWEDQKAAICASLESALHLHAHRLAEAVRAAEPEPRSILLAIDRARSFTLRAVSPALVAEVLDAAEAGVRRRSAAT